MPDFKPIFDPDQGPLGLSVYSQGGHNRLAFLPPNSDLAQKIAKIINSKTRLWFFDFFDYSPQIAVGQIGHFYMKFIKDDDDSYYQVVVNYQFKYNGHSKWIQMSSELTAEEYNNICNEVLKITNSSSLIQ